MYRAVRMKLQRDLTYNRDVIARSSAITNPRITEFYGNEVRHDPAQYAMDSMWRRYDY
jgi:hypothetical protein